MDLSSRQFIDGDWSKKAMAVCQTQNSLVPRKFLYLFSSSLWKPKRAFNFYFLTFNACITCITRFTEECCSSYA